MIKCRLLIFGIGNRQRNDDGAGAILAGVVAAVLNRRGIPTDVQLVHQLTPDLAAEIDESKVDGVIFADVEAGGTVRAIHALAAAAAAESSSHSCSPAVVLLIAERLYGRRVPAWLVTVPGSNFDHGETISAATQQALAGAETWAETWADQIARALI